jgi:predicted RNase H-like nuclease (RuvC/YqgF family)
MDTDERTLNQFATRVRQMILQYKDIEKENNELYAMVDERDAKIRQLEERLTQAENDYNSLKMAKMVEISDGDIELSRKILAKLIRDVDKCITLLSEK